MLPVAILSLAGCSKNEWKGIMDVTFEVQAPGLDPSAMIYVVGNHPALGDWDPGKVWLSHIKDDIWARTIQLPYGTRAEYKFTLGSWTTEALDENGRSPPNYTLAATRSRTIRHKVDQWQKKPSDKVVITGLAKFHRDVGGTGVLPRDIVVWLPPGYVESKESYPVLYVHDGQNLFDPTTSFLGVDWGIDETATRLIEKKKMKPVIVVGIYNSSQRSDDYGAGDQGKAYQKYVVDVVKPLIDANYRTLPDRENTATMGSSMGGLVSFLLAWNHPDVFRQAASLSPAFFPEVVDMVRVAEKAPDGMRLYVDNGTDGMDKKIQVFCDDMLDVLPGRGFVRDENFIWFLDEGADHNEQAWAHRVHRPLLFMFGTDGTDPSSL
jgi:pimeloyl-ACP methyl ester carboxylesterase